MKRNFKFRPLRKFNKDYALYKVNVKSLDNLKVIAKSKSGLQSAIGKIFNKKVFLGITIAGAIVGGMDHLWDYIEANSGCFKKLSDGSVCKVIELSCCQKNSVENIPNCPGMESFTHACENFDEDTEKSCCKLCSCEKSICDTDVEMKCQKPTVGDALTHFANEFGSSTWSALKKIFPWAPYVLYACMTLLGIWVLSVAWPIINKFLPRKRNQDV